MRASRLALVGILLCAASARADEPDTHNYPLASRSLASRGPLALSVAAEPSALHWGFESGFPLGISRGNAATLRDASPWRLDALVNASHDREDATNIAGIGYALRLERARERSAGWLGVSRGGSRSEGDPEARLRLGLGRVQSFGGVQAEVEWVASSVLFRGDPRWNKTRTFTYTSPADSGREAPRDSSVFEPADHAALWNTAQGALRWRAGRLSLASVGGLSLGDGVHARRWAQATVEWQVTRRVLMLGSMGERPTASLAFHSDAHPRTMVGIQFAPWSTSGWAMSGSLKPTVLAWRSEVQPHGRLLLRVHLRDVSSAEIAGDFTDWKPVPLERLHGGWWYAMLDVPPGVHRVQLRLNGGGWQLPPGLPRADDGPAGPSGTLVVLPAGD